ncbi:L-aspartate oxidase [Bacillus carboniphilus]|uniref:L-aspartate oxidase n=1 Tax=Bacillus carboniphilus TaxID=86663 RepID=A0ABY9K2E1_9BACI|nr:L-aspartate oxidase [Bacillus carboniphilus]WLR44071.1 L-aspartate oxidase [Bacillus carboniphilus]
MARHDVIIIGSGIAALSLAAQICEKMNVLVFTKSSREESNSILAQGGVAAVITEDDDLSLHVNDTIEAGVNHNSEEAVQFLVDKGSKVVKKLIQEGFPFDKDLNGNILLGREGAHQKNRIVHAGGDQTGKALTSYYLNRVKGMVELKEEHMVIDLIVTQGHCVGVKAVDQKGERNEYFAEHIVLATGGCGALYSYTSNQQVMTGDGLAIAYQAGARLSDLEFLQFHPTMLYVDGYCKGLISEAVRGEGAYLVNEDHQRIMQGLHKLEDLAPRDVVARAIFQERKLGKDVYLNVSPIKKFEKKFPTIYSMCQRNGIAIEDGLIPVAPGMHFLMGGVETDLKGRTSIPGLYAIGEVANTGVHGANRLASNSLLEGLVFGESLGQCLLQEPKGKRDHLIPSNTVKPIVVHKIKLPTKNEIQQVMSLYVGIERDEKGLKKAKSCFETYINQSSFWDINVNEFTIEELEIRNMLIVSYLITKSALQRKESRGGHFRLDFPSKDNVNWGKVKVVHSNETIKSKVGVG